MPTPVTVIGLGLMGHALAEAFLADGHPTTVWNRSPGKANDLVARGATLAVSPSAAVAASPLVIVCVADNDVARELLDPLAEMLQGRVLVNLTTSTAEQARDTAEWAAPRGITYLDGVIMAIPSVIGKPGTVILYSGPEQPFNTHEQTLRSLGGATTYLGADHGLSALYDMAILGIMWSTLNGFLQGAALLETANVPAATFIQTAIPTVAVVTEMATAYADHIDSGSFPALDSTLVTHVTAMDHLIHESQSAGINTEFPTLIKSLATRALAAGQGNNNYGVLIDQFRKPA